MRRKINKIFISLENKTRENDKNHGKIPEAHKLEVPVASNSHYRRNYNVGNSGVGGLRIEMDGLEFGSRR